MLIKRHIAMGAVLVSCATPCLAQVSTGNARASTPASIAAKGGDPDRVICVKEDVIGSRLGSKKVCRTAMEWKVAEREMRDTVNRVQGGKMLDQNSNVYLQSLTTVLKK